MSQAPPIVTPGSASTDGAVFGMTPDERDPAFVAGAVRRMRGFFGPGRYFRVSVEGWDHLPEEPSLLISNHSGGTSIPDVWGLGYAWHQQVGMERPLHALAHDMVFAIPQLGQFFGRLGVLRASKKQAESVLTEWRRDVLVMPGGDQDTWRPYRDRYKVNFAGRKGYVRLALKTGAPIVPVANAGAHETLLVLTDGKGMARRLHLDELFRAKIFPVSLALPWGLTIGPLPHIPVPAHLRYKVGAPIRPPTEWVGRDEVPQDVIDALDVEVRGVVQAMLDELREEADSVADRLGRHLGRLLRRVERKARHEDAAWAAR